MLKLIKALIPIIAVAICTFFTFGSMPIIVKVLWVILFSAIWFGRKFIQENLISWLQAQTVNPDPSTSSKLFDKLESFLWLTDSGEKKSSDAWTYKRVPNQASLRLIRIMVSIAIFVIFVGIPAIIALIFALISGGFDTVGRIFSRLMQDLSFNYGIVFFILALLEIISSIAVIVSVALFLSGKLAHTYVTLPIKDKSGHRITIRKSTLLLAITIPIQRIVSFMYFEYTFSRILGELLVIAIIVLAVRYFRNKH